MRIVLDTNVIVSALVFGGLPREILSWPRLANVNSFTPKPSKLRYSGFYSRSSAGAKPSWSRYCPCCGTWVS